MEDKIVREGEVWVEGEYITYVGPPLEEAAFRQNAGGRSSGECISSERVAGGKTPGADIFPDRAAKCAAPRFDRVIDAAGNLVMPGFKNAHTHSGMTFLRSSADDLPLREWLQCKVFPMEAKLDADKIYDLSRLAFLEYLTSGITACFDMYLAPDAVASAARDFGFRTVIVGSMNNSIQHPSQQEEWYDRYHGGDLVSYEFGFHAEYTNSRELLEDLAALARSRRAPVWAHNSETSREVEGCRRRYGGLTPTQAMESLGLFDFGGGGYHCIYMTDEDMEIFARRGLTAVLNPASNLKLASGIAPATELHARGINLAIGTDGPASNNCLDMFREMFLVAGLAKYRENDASAMDAAEVLGMATVGGAKAMRLADCDVLAPGKKADLIMIDLNRPNMQPENNIVKNIVYSGSKENVALTMINGEILYEKGEFAPRLDPQQIYRRAGEIARGLR